MSTQPAQFTTFTIPEKKESSPDLKNTLNRYLYHWPLFVLGLILAFAAAFLYTQTVKPVYEIKAALQIKDEKKAPDQQSALHEIDLVNSSKLIENEIEVLKSKQLISQVVQDLQLAINYQQKDGLSAQDLYQTSPVKFTLLAPTGNYQKASLSLTIKDKNSFLLILPDGKQQELLYKDSYPDSFGTWKLEPTKNLVKFTGETINITLTDPEIAALQYQKAIDVTLSNKLATTVALTLNDAVPQRGKDILNRLIFNYNAAAGIEKKQETKSTLDFLNKRIDSLGVELTDVEQQLENFKSSRSMTTDISEDSKISLQNLQASDTRLNEVNVQLSVIEGIERYVNSAQNTGKAPATLGITDAALSNLIEKLATLQLQRERLLATTPETNPDFEPINRQISITRTAIKENVKNIKSSLLDTRNKLQTYNSGFESSIKNIPTEERELVSIKRQQAIKENLYNYLLQKREEVSVSYASILANDRIVDQAYSASAKSNKSLAFAVAFVLGLGLPAGLIYARNSLSNKITTPQEVKDKLDIPVIAELPFEATKNSIVINSSTTAISEQFRSLRTKMHYLFGERESGRVTLLTSSVPGEGKSFVSSNLALALAYSDRKTVILELDLRKPQLTKNFNLSNNHPGLTDFIVGKASVPDIIQASGIEPNLDLISSGSTVNNPSELLERKQLKELILNLRNIYDDIIIDSPPVHLVPDAMILSRLTDITLYMIRQGFTQKSELDFIKELNNQKQLTNINLIFNGIERMKYGYGYNYNNKYYDQDEKSRSLNFIFRDFFNRF